MTRRRFSLLSTLVLVGAACAGIDEPSYAQADVLELQVPGAAWVNVFENDTLAGAPILDDVVGPGDLGIDVEFEANGDVTISSDADEIIGEIGFEYRGRVGDRELTGRLTVIVSNDVEPKPVEPKPVEPKPVEPKLVEPKLVEPKLVEPKPVEPKPVEPKPVEPTPVEPKPVEPKPVEPKPVEPKPVEPKPVEPKPVDPTPVDPTPVDPIDPPACHHPHHTHRPHVPEHEHRVHNHRHPHGDHHDCVGGTRPDHRGEKVELSEPPRR